VVISIPCLSIIIPVLDEALMIESLLKSLDGLRNDGAEVIVVDGGSRDDTVAKATGVADQVLISSAGRAVQMNVGARASRGKYLFFLHADTRLPDDVIPLLKDIDENDIIWGRFDIRLSGQRAIYRVIELFINWRSRLTGIATGDQVIFVNSRVFFDEGGYPEIALMEDIALSKRLKKICPGHCLRQVVETSSRRWKNRGALRTIVSMWVLRSLYFFGVDTEFLARIYYSER